MAPAPEYVPRRYAIRMAYILDLPSNNSREMLSALALEGAVGEGAFFRANKKIRKGDTTSDWTCELDLDNFQRLHGYIWIAGKRYRLRAKYEEVEVATRSPPSSGL